MTTATDHQRHEIESADAQRRQIRLIQVIFAGAATIATLVLFNAARPDDAAAVVAMGPVRLLDLVTDLPAPATDPFGAKLLQTPPKALSDSGFATDDSDPTDMASQDAQQTAQADVDLSDQETQEAEQQGADTQESILGPTLTGLP
jgi:hypothetical protein